MLDSVLKHVETILSSDEALEKADPALAQFLLETLGNVVLPSLPAKESNGENGWESEMESHLAVSLDALFSYHMRCSLRVCHLGCNDVELSEQSGQIPNGPFR